MEAQLLPLYNVNLSQPQLNSTSTLFQLNFDSTSLEPQSEINLSLNINFNSISTLTSTQYGCDIKATQSCLDPILLSYPFLNLIKWKLRKIEPYKKVRNKKFFQAYFGI